jgi:hypothetical protein
LSPETRTSVVRIPTGQAARAGDGDLSPAPAIGAHPSGRPL